MYLELFQNYGNIPSLQNKVFNKAERLKNVQWTFLARCLACRVGFLKRAFKKCPVDIFSEVLGLPRWFFEKSV